MVEGAEQDTKQLAQVHVVRSLFKTQPSTVVEVHGKLCRKALGVGGGGGGKGRGGEEREGEGRGGKGRWRGGKGNRVGGT